MPRPNKGARLFKRRARYKGKRLIAQAVWIIKDDGKHIASGCIAGPTETKPPKEAEQALSDYIAQKYQPARRKPRHRRDRLRRRAVDLPRRCGRGRQRIR